MLDKLSASTFTQISSTEPFVEKENEENSSDQVQRNPTMNLSEPISIHSVDSTQDQSNDDGYDLISDDSIQNDSKDDLDNKQRIIYSREQLIDISKLINPDYCPDWITNNINFPKRNDALKDQAGLSYNRKLIEWTEKDWPISNGKFPKKRNLGVEGNNNNGNQRKELSNEEDRVEQNESQQQSNSGFRLNLNRPGQENTGNNNKEFNIKSNSYGYNNNSDNNFNNHSNNNYKNNSNANQNNGSNRFNERQQMYNNNRNENRLIDDRIDCRGFLRSRGENLNQNFASFRRIPNRNQAQERPNNSNSIHSNNHHFRHQNNEPEWFTEGPISQHDTIELKGFDEDDDKSNANKNLIKNNDQQSPINQASQKQSEKQTSPISSHQQQIVEQQFKSNIAVNQPTEQQLYDDDFDISELEKNIDWQNADAQQNVDKITIENQANSSRFARWFNEPHPNQPNLINMPTEDQIEKLFSSARNPNLNQNSNIHPHLQQHLNQQQQLSQISTQNDFFGNLMNRNNFNVQNLAQHVTRAQPNQQQQQQPQYHQQISNRIHLQEQLESNDLMHQPTQKTDQQLFNILQKARINVNSLMQQNVLNKDNIIKGQVKSAEELEASLLNNNGSPVGFETNRIQSINQEPIRQTQHQVNPSDLFQKLCLNSINRPEFIPQDAQQKHDIKQQLDDNSINPFVMNLLDDAQKQKSISAVSNSMNIQHQNRNMINNHNRSNYLQNMMFNQLQPQLQQQQQEKREEKVNPFMPTSVIRKIAKDKNSIIGNKGLSETNFEIVTGIHSNGRSILNNRIQQEEQFNNQQKNILSNFAMNQANLMQQNYAITTGNRWNDNSNSIQQHNIDSTTLPNYRETGEQNIETLRNIQAKTSKKSQQVDPNTLFNNFSVPTKTQVNINQLASKAQNDNQKKLIEILQKASKNYGKATTEVGNKINNWFELELKRNNDHLSPIIKENAFTLEDIENN